MACRSCGHDNPDHARFCNQCGKPLAHTEDKPAAQPVVDHRSLYLDLFDLKLPAPLRTLDDVAAATAYLYERFTPFADDGWVWMAQPTSWDFEGWVYQDFEGTRYVAGAHLQCQRVGSSAQAHLVHRSHHVSQHRTLQLVGQPFAAEPGSKIWRVPDRS